MGIMFKETWQNPQRIVCHIFWYEMQASQIRPCSLATDKGADKMRVGVVTHLGLGSVEHIRLYVRVKCNFVVL